MHNTKPSEPYQPAATGTERRPTDDISSILQGFDEAVEALEALAAAARASEIKHRAPRAGVAVHQ